jgi:MATE family, multidrug efflux pump
MLDLALPVVIIQVGIMSMGVVDTIMVGHLSPQALAAVVLGNLYFFVPSVFGMGTLMVLDPVVAQAVGAGDAPSVARGVQRGVILAGLLSIPSAILLVAAEPILALLHQPADVVPLAASYSIRLAPGVLPFFLFIVLRQSLQILIYGRLGFPALGVAGSAWATTLSRWLLCLGLLAFAWRTLVPHLRPLRPEIWQPAPLGRMLRLGTPIGGQFVLEFGAFALVALMMGWLGTRQMAGHQVAINLASLTFMVPLGVADAASILVGRAVGRGDPQGARGSARAALVCAAAFMSCTGALFLSLPTPLARIYTSDLDVLAVASALIPIAGVFQVFDGLQTVGGGILRGLGHTRTPMVVNLLGYWALGLPVSVLLGFVLHLGPAGLWWGLVLGLGVVATFLLVRVRTGLARQQTRILIDLPAPAP